MCDDLARLSNADLLVRMHALVRQCNEVTAELLRHLAEVDARKLYADHGYTSMFAWCVEGLGMSESTSYKRIHAARAARRFPALLDRLAEGRIHLAGIVLVAPILTPQNLVGILDAVAGKSKREIEGYLADQAPKAATPPSVRKLPVIAPARPPLDPPDVRPTPSQEPASALTQTRPAPPAEPPSAPIVPSARAPQPAVAPLGGRRYKVQFTADQAWVDKLREAQALLSHRVPDGDLAEVLDRALTLLCEQLRKERFADCTAKAAKPAVEPRTGIAPSRHVPAAVRREVARRDGARCTFVAADGRRCNERRFLEFHHMDPWARGGVHAAENIALRCRTHNAHQARLDFGAAHVDAKIQARRAARDPTPDRV